MKSSLTDEESKECYDKMVLMKDSITKKRRTELQATKNEFNEYNLIFKKLRNLGYIEKLVDLINKYYDDSYSE